MFFYFFELFLFFLKGFDMVVVVFISNEKAV